MRSLGYFGVTILALVGPSHAQATENETAAMALQKDAPSSVGIHIEDHAEFRLLVHNVWQQSKIQLEYSPEIEKIARKPQYVKRLAAGKASNVSSARRSTYLPWVSAAEARHALPAGLLDALIWVESKYNPLAVSPKGAGGLGQLMPATASDLGVRNRFNAPENIDGSARYLRRMLDKFGLVHLAVAAYNAGPGAVARKRGIPANKETPGYVRQVLRQWSLSGDFK